MTKAEEITLFRDFCKHLPANSYLASILAGVPEEVERMIRNDWGYSLSGRLDDLLTERSRLQDETRKLHQQMTDMTQQIKALKQNLAWAEMKRSGVTSTLREALQILQCAS